MNYNMKTLTPILSSLEIPEDFYDESVGVLTLKEFLEDNFDLSTESGLTKLVCILNNTNYVIKIPYNQYLDFDDEKEYPIIMKGATGDSTDEAWDYCAQEVYIYNLAKLYQVEKAFPETIYLGKWNNWPIYLQEKCETIKRLKYDFKTSRLIKQTNKKVIKIIASKNLPYIDEDWISFYYIKHGEAEMIKLLNFVKYYKIEDLHSRNIGFSSIDNRPVLIDFSSFNM